MMMSAFFSPAPLLVVVLLLLMVVAHPRGGLIIEHVSAAGCPYSSVWFPYAASRTTSSAVTPPHNRRLLAEDVVVLPPRGAGRCIAANPFSGGSDCIQYSGPAWTAKPESAKKDCDEGSSVPGITGVFTPDALCPAADGTNLVGTCSLNGGVSSPNEKRLVVANNGLSSPQINMARMACTTFARGMWIPNDSDSVPSSTTTTTTGAASRIEAPPPSSSSISASSSSSSSSPAAELVVKNERSNMCELEMGIAGGGHMSKLTNWTSSCPFTNSTYALPMRWMADYVSQGVQKAFVTRGTAYYDAANNRKRLDTELVKTSPEHQSSVIFSGFRDGNNKTSIIHDGGQFFYFYHDTGKCMKSISPVGTLRPTWHLDSEGAGCLSQYLGNTYIVYDDKSQMAPQSTPGDSITLVRQWRKTEPLENAYMISSFESTPSWNTSEGKKARLLQRTTPGAPGMRDTIDTFYNHSTEFSDKVFTELFEQFGDCDERMGFSADGVEGFDFSEFLASGDGGDGNINAFLNPHSGLEVDRGFVENIWIPGSQDQESSAAAVAPTETEQRSSSSSITPTSFKLLVDGWAEVSNDISDDATTHTTTMSVNASAVDGKWIALSFPEFECAMVPAIAFVLEAGDEKPAVYDLVSLASVKKRDELPAWVLELDVKRNADNKIHLRVITRAPGENARRRFSTTNINIAHGVGGTLSYHGPNGRACVKKPDVDA